MYHLQCVAQLHRTVPCPPAGIKASDQVGTVSTLSPSLLDPWCFSCPYSFWPHPCLFPLFFLFPCSPLSLSPSVPVPPFSLLLPTLSVSTPWCFLWTSFCKITKARLLFISKKSRQIWILCSYLQSLLDIYVPEPVIKMCLALLEEQLLLPLRHK